MRVTENIVCLSAENGLIDCNSCKMDKLYLFISSFRFFILPNFEQWPSFFKIETLDNFARNYLLGLEFQVIESHSAIKRKKCKKL